jgi:hypothetical protein
MFVLGIVPFSILLSIPNQPATTPEQAYFSLIDVKYQWRFERFNRKTQLPHRVPVFAGRTSVGDNKAAGLVEARKFMEERVAAWDKGARAKAISRGRGSSS